MTTPPLQLDGYCIDRFEFTALTSFKEARGTIEVEVSVEPQHMTRVDDPHSHQIVLDVRFKPVSSGSAPYKGRIIGRGFFRITEELDEAATARYVLLNGSAILLGLLRGHVAQSTALGRWGQFLIPPVNLVEAFENTAVLAREDG